MNHYHISFWKSKAITFLRHIQIDTVFSSVSSVFLIPIFFLDMAHSDSDFESRPPTTAHQKNPDYNLPRRRVKKLARKTTKFFPRHLRILRDSEGGSSYYVSFICVSRFVFVYIVYDYSVFRVWCSVFYCYIVLCVTSLMLYCLWLICYCGKLYLEQEGEFVLKCGVCGRSVI